MSEDYNAAYKNFQVNILYSMFVERWVSSRALITFLVGWNEGAVSMPPWNVIIGQLACPLNDVIFSLHQEKLTYISTNIGCSIESCYVFNALLYNKSKRRHASVC